ncbi:AsmA family protein [Phycisphaerae bacterium RAS1]|nr:AsmA family protein [Phycisphaerae bacterium RAS1]
MSRKRRRIRRLVLHGALVVLVGLLVAYAYVTRPSVLRAWVLNALTQRPGLAVRIGGAEFSPWNGLQVFDLEIAGVKGESSPPPVTLRAAQVDIHCSLWRLLAGHVRIREIIVRGAELNLVRDPAALTPAPTDSTATRPAQAIERLFGILRADLPRIRIADADIRCFERGDGKPRLLDRWRVRADAARNETGLVARVAQLGSAERPMLSLAWREPAAELQISSDWLDLEPILSFFPPDVVRYFAACDAHGRVRLEHALLRSDRALNAQNPLPALASAVLQFSDLRCSLPVEARQTPDGLVSLAPSQRFLNVSGGRLELALNRPLSDQEGVIQVSGDALLNDSRAHLNINARSRFLDELLRPGPETEAVEPRMGDVNHAALTVEAFNLPTVQSAPLFVHSPRMHRGIVAFFDDFLPRGRMNVRIQVPRRDSLSRRAAEAADKPIVEAELEPLGVNCRYYKFPYDFEDARGRFRVVGGSILIDGVTVRHGSGVVHVKGDANHSKPWTGMNLHFTARSLVLDEDLYAALPPTYQQLWAAAAPVGVCDVVTTLTRAEGTPGQPPHDAAVRVEARVVAASLNIDQRTRLTQADGLLIADDDRVQIVELFGYDGDTAVRICNADVAGGSGQERVAVQASGVAIRRSTPVATGDGNAAAEIRFDGRGDVWGTVAGKLTEGGESGQFAVHLTDGALTTFDPARAWQDVRGWVSINSQQQRIADLTARQGASRLRASGTLPEHDGDAPLRLSVTASGPAIGDLLAQLVPPQWKPLADSFGFGGSGEVCAEMTPAAGGSGGGQDVALELCAATMVPEFLPVELRAVSARARIEPDGFELESLDGRYGPQGDIVVRGRGSWGGATEWLNLAVTAQGWELCPKLIAALPPGIAAGVNRFAPAGAIDVKFEQLGYEERGGQRTWVVDGDVRLRNGVLELGSPLTEADGRLAGVWRIDADGRTQWNGGFTIERGFFAGRRIADWEGQIAQSPGTDWLRLENLRGKLCGGDVLGGARLNTETSTYELSLDLRSVRLDELAAVTRKSSEPAAGDATVDGHVYLEGASGPGAWRLGGGSVRVTGASFLKTPVLMQVFELILQTRRARPSEDLDVIELRFSLDGALVRFSRIDIQGRDLRLVGEGTLNLDGNLLSLSLLSAHPKAWPRVLVLSDFLEAAGRELAAYRIEGPVTDPRVTVEPLHNIAETLRRLGRE